MNVLDHKVCVAPMMQYTDMHDRYLLRLISKKVFLYTEMIATGSLVYGRCFNQLEFNKEEHPVGVQLGGSDIKDLIECSKKCEDYGYNEINLNCGCPSDRVQKGRFGACLMLEANHVAECLSEMQNAVEIPVSIKCRLGIDHHDSYEFLYDFVSTVKESGTKIFIIHARNGILKGLSPRQNRNIPPLKYDYVYKLKKDFPDLEIIIIGHLSFIASSIARATFSPITDPMEPPIKPKSIAATTRSCLFSFPLAVLTASVNPVLPCVVFTRSTYFLVSSNFRGSPDVTFESSSLNFPSSKIIEKYSREPIRS